MVNNGIKIQVQMLYLDSYTIYGFPITLGFIETFH